MFDVYRSTVDKLYWGRRYLTRQFFEIAGRDFRRHLCLVCAFRDGKLIAGTYNLEKAGVMYGRYWGCFEELRYLHFNVCYYAAIEHCIGISSKAGSSTWPIASSAPPAASSLPFHGC